MLGRAHTHTQTKYIVYTFYTKMIKLDAPLLFIAKDYDRLNGQHHIRISEYFYRHRTNIETCAKKGK